MADQGFDNERLIATRRRPPSLVVGIGASAGGLAACRSFFDHMPADTGMAFVLGQHLDPNHKSNRGVEKRAGRAIPADKKKPDPRSN